MLSNSEQFRKIMSNIVIADPITSKGKDALSELRISISETDYLEKIYVPPFTFFNYSNSEISNSEIDPDYEPGYVKTVELNSLNGSKTAFENKLRSLADSFFVIKGGAGTGKTIYVHHLEQECPSIHFCFCDFESSSKSISLFDVPYDFEDKYSSNVWKFISILSAKVSKLLFYKYKEYGFSSLRKYIKSIINVYKRFFSIVEGEITIVDENDMWSFFTILQNYSNNKLIPTKSFKNELANHISKKYDEFEKQNMHHQAVVYVCGILIRLFFCVNRLLDQKGINKKFICVIDNIEYYVPFDEVHPIQECELQTIMNGVSEAISHIKPKAMIWRKIFPEYENFFGFLLVTRDTSVTLADYRQYDDYTKDSEIDITSWFYLEDIYKLKAIYFGDVIEKLELNPYYTAYQNIISDISLYNWGMHDMICKMYCYNNRRIGFDVVNAIAYQPESDIVYFNEMWSQCTKKDYDNWSLKHLCRKFVLRVILDYIQRTEYFNALMVEKNRTETKKKKIIDSDYNNSSSFARKIATTLYRFDIESVGETKEFMTFPEIVEAVLAPPYLSDLPSKEQIEDLASILYLMNETRNSITNWSPLIMIKFDTEKAYNKGSLAHELFEEWSNYKKNNTIDNDYHKYGVRITTAGAFFAKIVPDFEYFACRFASNYPALFVRENLGKTNSKLLYRCIELIDIVKENAFWCVDEVIKRDSLFFSSTGRTPITHNRYKLLYETTSRYKWIYISDPQEGKAIAHPLRILNHQVGYLLHYVEYLKMIDCSLVSEEDRKKIIILVKQYINEYNDKINSIKKDNPEYFLLN